MLQIAVNMIGLSFTLDYEIYGNGEGTAKELIVDSTNNFINICEDNGIRCTLFVEVAEILKMKEYDYFKSDIEQIESQLRSAHQMGHDIQLHIHPWWFKAKFVNKKWEMDYSLASLCQLNSKDAYEYIKLCKDYLVQLFKNCDRKYSCIAFRAGSWSMMPTSNIYNALVNAGIQIDSSVFKWGILSTKYMNYDYSNAHSNLFPWFFCSSDINKICNDYGKEGKCLEIPIYAENQIGFRFLTRKRISLLPKINSIMIDKSSKDDLASSLSIFEKKVKMLFKKTSKKFDFCKCTLNEMKMMTKNILKSNKTYDNGYLPVVSIGHSKDFIYKKDFEKFLKYLRLNYSDVVEGVPLKEAAKKFLESSSMKIFSNKSNLPD